MKSVAYQFKSKNLGEAFEKDLSDLGYQRHELGAMWYNNHTIIYTEGDVYSTCMPKSSADKLCEVRFQLESQYQEALDFAKREIRAHEESNDSNKEQIEEHNKPEFEKGKWYALDGCEGGSKFLGVYKKTAPDGTIYLDTPADCSDYWTVDNEVKSLRPATKKEIEQALIKEAKRRGLVDGSYGHLKSYAREFTGDYHLHLDWEYGHDILCIGHDWIWSSEEGWAEVIEPKLTIAGYEVEESNYDIRIGCTSLPKDTLIKFFEVRDRAKREGIDLYSEEVDKLKELL